jgi:hypothetical protein
MTFRHTFAQTHQKIIEALAVVLVGDFNQSDRKA